MTNNESKHLFFPVSYEYKRMEKILTLNPTVFEPCHGKVDWEWSWRKLKNVKFGLHFTKQGRWKIIPISSGFCRKDSEVKLLRQRIEEIKDMIQKLSEKVATKRDLEKTEKILIRNQETLQAMLRENMADLKKTLGRDIEKKAGKRKTREFWKILEKIATVSDIIDFAKHVRDLLAFLYELNMIQLALPLLLKMILG